MRIVVTVFCALMVPLALRAQSPTPAPVQESALRAAAALDAMSGLTARPAWHASSALDDVLADAAAVKRKKTGKLLLIIGGSAVVAGAIVGGGGGAALIVAGILTGGYGLWLFQEK